MSKYQPQKHTSKSEKHKTKVSTLAHRLFLVALPSAISIIAVFVLLNIHISTRLRVELTVSRISFQLANTAPGNELFRSFDSRSFSLDNFSTANIFVERLDKADPNKFNFAERIYPANSWQRFINNRSLIKIKGKGPGALPFIRLEPANDNALLTVDPIRVKPGSHIVLDAPGFINPRVESPPRMFQGNGQSGHRAELSAQFELDDSTLRIYTHGAVDIHTRDCALQMTQQILDANGGVDVYRAYMSAGDESLSLNSRSGTSHLFFVPERKVLNDLLLSRSIDITGPAFVREIANLTPEQESRPLNRYVSAIDANATNTITYLDYPQVPQVTLPKSAVLFLDKSAIFRLDSMDIPENIDEFHLTMEGRPSLIYSEVGKSGGDRNSAHNYQLDLFTALKASKFWVVLAVATWFMSSTLAARKVLTELKNENKK